MTVRMSILNQSLALDTGVYISPLNVELALTNAKKQLAIVLPYPTGADLGIETEFQVPQNYSSTPVLKLSGYIDGTPANTFGIGAQLLQRDVSETADAAYEAEDVTNNADWTGYADEERFSISLTITPSAALVAGRAVLIKFFRDDSVDSTTWNFLMTDLEFSYTEA